MEDAPEFKKDPTRAFTAKETKKGLNLIVARREALDAVVKAQSDMVVAAEREINKLSENILQDNNIDIARGLHLYLATKIQGRIALYEQQIADEEAKEQPSRKQINYLQDKIDLLLIQGLSEQRKLNEGQFTMKHGKRNTNVNVTVDKPTAEEWLARKQSGSTDTGDKGNMDGE